MCSWFWIFFTRTTSSVAPAENMTPQHSSGKVSCACREISVQASCVSNIFSTSLKRSDGIESIYHENSRRCYETRGRHRRVPYFSPVRVCCHAGRSRSSDTTISQRKTERIKEITKMPGALPAGNVGKHREPRQRSRTNSQVCCRGGFAAPPARSYWRSAWDFDPGNGVFNHADSKSPGEYLAKDRRALPV